MFQCQFGLIIVVHHHDGKRDLQCSYYTCHLWDTTMITNLSQLCFLTFIIALLYIIIKLSQLYSELLNVSQVNILVFCEWLNNEALSSHGRCSIGCAVVDLVKLHFYFILVKKSTYPVHQLCPEPSLYSAYKVLKSLFIFAQNMIFLIILALRVYLVLFGNITQ